MKTRFIAFSVFTAVGICFSASQSRADEPYQPNEITQSLAEPSAGNKVTADPGEELTASEELMISEEIVEIDELVDQTDANESGFQEIGEGPSDDSDEIVRIVETVESEGTVDADTMADDELLEWYEVPIEVTEEEDVDANVQVLEDAAADDSEVMEEEIAEFVTDEELSEELGWAEGFDESWGESAAAELIEEATIGEETVEPTEVVEAEDNIDVVDLAIDEGGVETVELMEELIEEVTSVDETVEPTEVVEIADSVEANEPATEEEATNEDSAEIVEAEETTDVEVTEESSEELIGDAEWSEGYDDWFYEDEYGAEASIDEGTTVDETVDAIEPVIEETVGEETTDVEMTDKTSDELIEQAYEEELTVEEAVEAAEANEDRASPIATETLEEEGFEQEAVEHVQYIIAGPSRVTEDNIEEKGSEDVDDDSNENLETDAADGVLEDEEMLEVPAPLSEEAELEEAESKSTNAEDMNESEAGTVRTIELGGCTIIIKSERQVCDYELLDMLMEAVYQLEAEMD